jgi:hypothetical protein
MPHYTLKVCHRAHPKATAGWVTEVIELDAADHEAATTDALGKLGHVQWKDHFAFLEGENGKFVAIWTEPNA